MNHGIRLAWVEESVTCSRRNYGGATGRDLLAFSFHLEFDPPGDDMKYFKLAIMRVKRRSRFRRDDFFKNSNAAIGVLAGYQTRYIKFIHYNLGLMLRANSGSVG